MPPESIEQKAQRFLAAGRVCCLPSGDFAVQGDTRRYVVKQKRDGRWRCECPVPARVECSHRTAVRLWLDEQKALVTFGEW